MLQLLYEVWNISCIIPTCKKTWNLFIVKFTIVITQKINTFTT